MAYPGAIESFTAKTDNIDTVHAADVNELQTAFVNIETELGVSPSGTYDDVADRLAALESATYKGSTTIADDNYYSFTPDFVRGVIILRGQGSNTTEYAMFTYAAVSGTAYAYAWVNGSDTVITTGALSGSIGTDGKLTISAHTDGKIYIENRRGGQRAYAWQIVAGV